jgi:hypothetical protein
VRTEKLRNILGQTLATDAKSGKGKRDRKAEAARHPHTAPASTEQDDTHADPAAPAPSSQDESHPTGC